jgi:V/A-type H+-transporting ATPase subunit K
MLVVFAVLVGLVPVIPAVLYVLQNGRTNPAKAVARLVNGFNAFNFLVGFMAAGLGLVWLASPSSVLAAGSAQGIADQYASLAAALSTGLACIGAGIAVGGSGAAAVGATAEKPESFGRSLIFVGLSEGIAIYGLIISFLVLPR